jgi:RNA polymerase sigma factor (sigma-70 family)
LLNFASRADEASFAAIVDRHGKVVLGVCRRVLGHGPDSDDAFQATFVVLARKAASIRQHHSLASWLYGVAYRVASEARRQRSRRRKHETAAAAARTQVGEKQSMDTNPARQASFREIGTLLDEELQHLPRLERDAVVACLLEGMSHSEAARHLGWPLGTLKTRLERGRQALRQGLEQRGLALSAAALTVVLTEQMAAAVPPTLAQTTLQAAAHRAGSPAVMALADRATLALSASKWKLASVGMLTACLLGLAAVALGLTDLGKGSSSDPPLVRQEPPPDQDVNLAPAVAEVPNLPAGAIAAFGAVPFHNGSRIEASTLSADGKRLATLGRRSATVWDLATGRPLHRFFFDMPVLWLSPRMVNGWPAVTPSTASSSGTWRPARSCVASAWHRCCLRLASYVSRRTVKLSLRKSVKTSPG